MSVATSNDEIFRLLLKQSDQPHEISGELVEDLRVEWAEREAMSRIADLPAVTHEIVMNRWLALAARSPVPIGRGAIRSDHRLATDPFSRTTLEQSFVLPGNEILDFPITGEVAGSFCELLFLATMITTETPAITSWEHQARSRYTTGHLVMSSFASWVIQTHPKSDTSSPTRRRGGRGSKTGGRPTAKGNRVRDRRSVLARVSCRGGKRAEAGGYMRPPGADLRVLDIQKAPEKPHHRLEIPRT